MPTVTLRADRDAYVAEDAPDAAHGGELTLKVESKVLLVAANKRVLCGFDLSGLPASAVRVVRATLRLVPLLQTRGRLLRCHAVAGAWDEAAVTWNTQPGVEADHGVRASESNPHDWDVTASAQGAFPRGRASFRVKDDAEGSLLAMRQEYAARERTGQPPALVVVYEDQRSAGLPSSVRPRLPARADLAATLVVAEAGAASLRAAVRPRFTQLATLVAALQPRLRRGASLWSSVRVNRQEASTPRPGAGWPGAMSAVPDFAVISAEVGSTITHISGEVRREVKRVIHLVDTREVQSFPRAVTSEQGRPSTQDQLRRGDAVVYALGSDAFLPGDTVAWQGQSWVVVGTLGVEMVGDVRVYQEVGLRRLPVVVMGRVHGTITS